MFLWNDFPLYASIVPNGRAAGHMLFLSSEGQWLIHAH